MSVIIFFSASKQLFFCRNDVQAIDFLRKGSYAPDCFIFLLRFTGARGIDLPPPLN